MRDLGHGDAQVCASGKTSRAMYRRVEDGAVDAHGQEEATKWLASVHTPCRHTTKRDTCRAACISVSQEGYGSPKGEQRGVRMPTEREKQAEKERVTRI